MASDHDPEIPMPRYVTFLRGINLGKRRVKMDTLRECFEELGLEGVDTFIASGNVVFDHPGHADRSLEEAIERHLESALGFEVAAFIRPLSALAGLSEPEDPASAAGDEFTPHVIFLRSAPDAGLKARVSLLETPDDQFRFGGREIIWLRRGRLSDSPIEARELERALGGSGNTMRNLNTVRRIVAKFEEME